MPKLFAGFLIVWINCIYFSAQKQNSIILLDSIFDDGICSCNRIQILFASPLFVGTRYLRRPFYLREHSVVRNFIVETRKKTFSQILVAYSVQKQMKCMVIFLEHSIQSLSVEQTWHSISQHIYILLLRSMHGVLVFLSTGFLFNSRTSLDLTGLTELLVLNDLIAGAHHSK